MWKRFCEETSSAGNTIDRATRSTVSRAALIRFWLSWIWASAISRSSPAFTPRHCLIITPRPQGSAQNERANQSVMHNLLAHKRSKHLRRRGPAETRDRAKATLGLTALAILMDATGYMSVSFKVSKRSADSFIVTCCPTPQELDLICFGCPPHPAIG